MIARRLQTAAIFAFLSTPALLLAQEISSAEEQRLEALARAEAEIYVPRNNVSVGFRLLGSNSHVRFSNLGNVPVDNTPADLSGGSINRTYDNGYVHTDAPRANESDGDGVQTSIPGSRYTVMGSQPTYVYDANGNVVGTINAPATSVDGLSYTPGLTRNWSYSLPSQADLRPGYIAMSNYSATSDGAAFDKKQRFVGGVELQFARTLGKGTGRTQWSVATGISINTINVKSSQDFTATLHAGTDYYSLNGQAAPDTSVATPYVAPYTPDAVTEATVPVSALPVDHTDTATVGGATVHGLYQVKGAYFMLKLGPSVHRQLSERFGVSASIGVAGVYAGTSYTATEKLDIPEMGTTISTADPEGSSANKVLGGYYADCNFDYSPNETTALYAGVTAQKLGSYVQMLGSRAADIDLGSAVGLRGGISIKF